MTDDWEDGAMPHAGEAALIALDWGTTSCRAYLLSRNGDVLDERSADDGVMALVRRAEQEGRDRAGCFEEAFERLCGAWLDAHLAAQPGDGPAPLPVIASGMVGSTQGWVDAPYLPIPLDLLGADLELTAVPARRATVHVVPGLISTQGLPGVMRGEETQLVGALLDRARAGADDRADDRAHDRADRVVVLPGTHTKWVRLRGAVVEGFTTCLTGETYGLLASRSILGALAVTSPTTRWDAFDRGVEVATGPLGAGGPLVTLFSSRSLVLTGHLEPVDVLDYLSGLLIGSEVLGMQRAWLQDETGGATGDVLLCGADDLCARYARALAACGVGTVQASALATSRALAHIARQAGLLRDVELDRDVDASVRPQAPQRPARPDTGATALPSRPGVASPSGLVAILRGITPDEAEAVGQSLYAAGFRVLEVPLNSPDPLDTIRRLVASLPADALVGAGTVLDVDDVGRVQEAGGRLVVSPNTDVDVIRETRRRGMASYPGVATPTEAFAAVGAGARAVKLFPADAVGVAGMRAWTAVLPREVELIPVGGVDAGTIGAWVDAGATGFGIGSSLYRPGVTVPELRRRADELVAAWRSASGGAGPG